MMEDDKLILCTFQAAVATQKYRKCCFAENVVSHVCPNLSVLLLVATVETV